MPISKASDDNITEILGLDIVEPKYESPKIIFKNRDVRDEKISDDLKGYDAIIHLAFIVAPIKNQKKAYSINVEGSENVFNCAVKAGLEKIVHASSVATYGSFPDNPIPITEEPYAGFLMSGVMLLSPNMPSRRIGALWEG